MLLNITTFSWNTGSLVWKEYEKANYVFSPQSPSSIMKLNILKCLVYPNPSKNYIYFDLQENFNQATIKIFDSKGLLFLSSNFYSSKSINITNYPSGIYVYTLETENKVQTGRFIKD
jgi:hypothetical protein